MSAWTPGQIPDLSGRRALVTGVTSGLGEQVVLELARAGAEVLAAGRDLPKLQGTLEGLRRTIPSAALVPLVLDLADLSSVRRAAAEARAHGPLDLLVNNAGVMATPRRRTVDAFEHQLGTNHLGHFALTGLVWDQLAESASARVVTVSSVMHRVARSIDLRDPRDDSRRYDRWHAYGQSKLANLLFAFELERRAAARGLPVTSMAAHPGYASTDLIKNGPNQGRRGLQSVILLGVTRLVAQSAAAGAQPILMAATMPDLPGGSFVGPSGLGEISGPPTLVGATRAARDEEAARRLWELSERATGVRFP